MSELYRIITKEEFDQGISQRLKLGEFTIGSSVILSANVPGGLMYPPTDTYARAVVDITKIKPVPINDINFLKVEYEFQASMLYHPEGFRTGRWGALFSPDSIAWAHRRPAAYFSNHALETWDEAVLTELNHIEIDDLLSLSSTR